MKGYLSLILGSLIFALMLVAPGNSAQAKVVVPEDCDCQGTYLVGAEGNKWVSDLLKSDEFKSLKKELKEEGYKWAGSSENSVFRIDAIGIMMIRTPFVFENGSVEFAVFMHTPAGFQYRGKAPANLEH